MTECIHSHAVLEAHILKSISWCQSEGIIQFWVIWVGPKYNHMYPYKREAERF